jgi:hypothetical protein
VSRCSLGKTEGSRCCERSGPFGEVLCIDFAFLKGSEVHKEHPPDVVMLHTSGIHGVEGYVGSAIQLRLLEELASGRSDALVPPPKGMTVLIHAVNPFGMAWNRRFNEGNVDLNRNWLLPSAFERLVEAGLPALFGQYTHLIMADYVPDPTSWFEWLYTRSQATLAIAQHGLTSLKEAIAKGHSALPDGIYFAGREMEQSPRLIRRGLVAIGVLHPCRKALSTGAKCDDVEAVAVAAVSAGALWAGLRGPRRVVMLDVHSGLGRPGQSSLLITGGGPAAALRRALGVTAHDECVEPREQVVQDSAASGSDGVAYLTLGGFTEGIAAMPGPHGLVCAGEEASLDELSTAYGGMSASDRVCFAQEFGTVSPTDVFFALRAESALTRFEPAAPASHPLRQGLLKVFCPDSPDWRRECVGQGVSIATKVALELYH